MRSGPRSSPTTVRPALVNSRARIVPVQPMPTMTASTSFKRVAIAPSRKVGDRLRLDEIALVAILIDAVGVERRQAWIADHLPCDLRPVPAIDRIREEPFHHRSDQCNQRFPPLEIAD